MWSASSPWPQASWKRMPPLPPASTTGSSPGRCRSGRQLGQRLAWRPCGPAPRPTPRRTARTRACGRPSRTRSASRCRPSATHDTRNRVRACSSPASRPSELAISTRRRERPEAGLDLADGVARRPGPPRRPAAAGRAPRPSCRSRRAAASPPVGPSVRTRPAGRPPRSGCRPRRSGHRRGRLGRPQQSALAQIGGVGEARGLPGDHPDAGPPLAPRGQLLDPAVVEHGRRSRPVLGEHLGECRRRCAAPPPAPVPARGYRSLRPPRSTARRQVADVSVSGVSYRRGPPYRSVRAHRARGDRGRHRRGLPDGLCPRPRHPPPGRPVRGGQLPGHRRAPAAGTHLGGQAGPVRPPGAGRRRRDRSGPRPPSTGSRGAGWCSPCRSPRTAGLVAAGKLVRVIVDRDTFLANVR